MTVAPTSTISRFLSGTLRLVARQQQPPVQRSPHLTIFCDLDGPLIDVSSRYYKTYQLALAETQAHAKSQGNVLSLTPLNLDQFWSLKQSKRPDHEIARLSGLHDQYIDYFLQQVQIIVNQPLLLREDRLQPGVHSALEELLNLGAQLAVVTLRCQSQAIQVLQQYHLARYFKLIRGTHNTQAAYQNYAIRKQALLQEAVQIVGTRPSQTWMIGDTEADIRSAQALNMQTVALTCGIRNSSFLQNLQPSSIQSNLTDATRFISAIVLAAEPN